MKINPGNARGLLVPQGDRPFSFVVYSSEIRDFGYLTKIPGLNEHFLYFNDDMFINRHLSPREFFDGDKPIVWMADEYFGRFPENISVEDNIRMSADEWERTLLRAWDLFQRKNNIKIPFLRKLFKSTLNNRLHRNLACVIDKSSRGAKLERAFEELP